MSTKKAVLMMLSEAGHEASYVSCLKDSDYLIKSVINSSENIFLKAARLIPDLILIEVETLTPILIEQLRLLKREHAIPVVLFCASDSRESIRHALSSGVTVYISETPKLERLVVILDTAMIRFEEYQALYQDLMQTKAVLVERKLIEKAKGILMRQSRMDEQTTYKTMRKMSMDRNLKMAELSQTIITAAEHMN